MKIYLSIRRQWLLRIGIFFLILFMLLTSALIGLLVSQNGYALTFEESRLHLFQSITERKCYTVMEEWDRYSGYSISEYSMSPDFRGKNHFRFAVLSPEDETLYSTLPSDTIQNSAAHHTLLAYESTHTSPDGFTWTDRYVRSSSESTDRQDLLYTLHGYYTYESETTDIYDLAELLLNIAYPLRYFLPAILFVCLVLLLILWCRMTVHTGHRQYLPDHPRYTGDVVLSFFDRLPGDLYLTALVFLLCFNIILFQTLRDLFNLNLYYLACWWGMALLSLLITLVMAMYITIVTRLKAKTLLKNTLIWRCISLAWRLLCRCCRYICRLFAPIGRMWSTVPLFWQAALTVPVVLLGYGLLSSLTWETFGIFLLWLLATLALYLLILYAAYCFRILMSSGKALADGNLQHKTDTAHLFFFFRSHGEHLNRIGEGMERALAEKMRSERLKTELITNVSHDIKTPLTSIINYTDLLSKEPLEGAAREYTEVLSRQAARLKKLTEDLIEASKASTGNIAMNPERLDLCQIVRQSLGEYAARLAAHDLQIVETIPAEEIYVTADGRQLWRVLDNLFSNVCKYALSGTRVYVLTAAHEDCVSISIKNISRDPLMTASDELTERFVQGDASRSSEGSGLGLNIAKSLTELQGGTLQLCCDGDLFRADITFPIAE